MNFHISGSLERSWRNNRRSHFWEAGRIQAAWLQPSDLRQVNTGCGVRAGPGQGDLRGEIVVKGELGVARCCNRSGKGLRGCKVTAGGKLWILGY